MKAYKSYFHSSKTNLIFLVVIAATTLLTGIALDPLGFFQSYTKGYTGYPRGFATWDRVEELKNIQVRRVKAFSADYRLYLGSSRTMLGVPNHIPDTPHYNFGIRGGNVHTFIEQYRLIRLRKPPNEVFIDVALFHFNETLTSRGRIKTIFSATDDAIYGHIFSPRAFERSFRANILQERLLIGLTPQGDLAPAFKDGDDNTRYTFLTKRRGKNLSSKSETDQNPACRPIKNDVLDIPSSLGTGMLGVLLESYKFDPIVMDELKLLAELFKRDNVSDVTINILPTLNLQELFTLVASDRRDELRKLMRALGNFARENPKIAIIWSQLPNRHNFNYRNFIDGSHVTPHYADKAGFFYPRLPRQSCGSIFNPGGPMETAVNSCIIFGPNDAERLYNNFIKYEFYTVN